MLAAGVKRQGQVFQYNKKFKGERKALLLNGLAASRWANCQRGRMPRSSSISVVKVKFNALINPCSTTFVRNFHQRALDKVLLLRPAGNTVYLMPPYVITDDKIALLASRNAELLDVS